MKKLFFITICILLVHYNSNAQYTDYIGAGHASGIVATSSSQDGFSRAQKSVNGTGMDAELMDASRFMSQASFGADLEEIQRVADIGKEKWLEEQFFTPVTHITPLFWEIWDELYTEYQLSFDLYLAEYINELCLYAENDPNVDPPNLTNQEVEDLREFFMEDIFGPYALHFNFTWSHSMMTSKDQLRQRVAYALSQILVVSSQSDLGDHGEVLTTYFDILLDQSFGNFKDLLMDITVNPAMASYLSHLNNPKAVPSDNIHPDENYAREIMQLFTIGLYELNLDGSRIQNADGYDIPTYNQTDVKELAKVFTGLAAGSTDPTMEHVTWNAYFGIDLYSMNKTEPLIMYENQHEPGPKSLLNGLEIPGGQDGMTDIEMAIDYIFNHKNVGPFIGRQLIQRLVKSNPSPQYIERVATVFNDNGFGERGDLQAVVQAILLDEEARSCEDLQKFENGKLREPVLRNSEFVKVIPTYGEKKIHTVDFNSYTCDGYEISSDTIIVFDNLRYWNNGYNYFDDVRQYPFMAPSVFNFYLPDHQPVGPIQQNDLVAPEFKIHDSSTAINYLNQVFMFTAPYYDIAWYNWYDQLGFEDIKFNYNPLVEVYKRDPELLIHELDIVFTDGLMTEDFRNILREFNKNIPLWITRDYSDIAVKALIYLIMWSPDYAIAK